MSKNPAAAATARYRAKNAEKCLAEVRAWRKKNPDKVHAGQKRYREKHPELTEINRARRFGLTREQLVALIASNPNCAICGDPAQVVDHDHETKEVRGMLCHKCNRGIGFLNDDPALIRRALDYLT